MGIQLRIALKNEMPQDFEYSDLPLLDAQTRESQTTIEKQPKQQSVPEHAITNSIPEEQKAVPAGGNADGKG
jgi:hypothetical protein